MRVLHTTSEAAMVAAFLRAEFGSARFGDDLHGLLESRGVAAHLITRPDLTDDRANALRADLLAAHRGGILAGVPDGLVWHEAELAREEIGGLRYLDYSYWNELTDHTRLVARAVGNIRAGRTAFGVPNDRFLALAELIRRGAVAFEPMILWGDPPELLEGHLRATAFGLAGDAAPATLRVLLGLSRSARSVP